MKKLLLFFVMVFWAWTHPTAAQLDTTQKKMLLLQIVQQPNKKLEKSLRKIVPQETSQTGAMRIKSQLENLCFAEGYTAVWADLKETTDYFLIHLELGDPLFWKSINVDELSIDLRSALDLPQDFSQLRPGQLPKMVAEGLTFFENNGFPFANFHFDTIQIVNDSISATLRVEPGPLFLFDSIVVKGANVPNALIRLQLGIKKGARYSEQTLNNAQQKASGLPYLDMTRAPQFLFQKDKGTVFLYFENRKSSQFDGLVGLNTAEDGAITLNGDLNLRLLNALKTGEDFRINWRSPNAGVQQLATSLELPYLFKTPLGIRGNFNLFRQDSSWSNRNFGLELGYQIASGTFLNLGWDNSQSAVLQSAASASQGNVRASVVQTGITVRRFNDPLLPTKGLFLSMRIGQGTRQLETENFQLRQGHIEGQFYHTFNKKHGLFARVMAAGIFSDNLVENELHRLGGFKTLRGFNELTLFAANYGLANLEYRFFLERYSYLVAFFDAGILYNPVAIAPNLNLMGTGVGLNFRTGGGIFSLAVAVGRAPNQNFDLRLSKVHVGFVNQF